MDTKSIVAKIRNLDIDNKIKFIFLFGSVASGTNSPLSDVDLAIYYEGNKKERFDFQIKAAGISDKLDVKIFQNLPLTVRKEVISGQLVYYEDYQFMFQKVMDVIKEFRYFEKYYNEYLGMLRQEVLA